MKYSIPTYNCSRCGGTIGEITIVEYDIPTIGNPTKKYVETWFNCIYCKDNGDEPSKVLVSGKIT